MNNYFKNTKLFNYKKSLIEEFSNNKIPKQDYVISNCCYLGQNLIFYSRTESFKNNLYNLIPTSWQYHHDLKENEVYHIYLQDPEDLSIELEWDSEYSQDCIIDGNMAIQRDFVAKVENKNIYLISKTEIGDGFYNFLRWFLPRNILSQNKIVLHSSCVIFNNGNANFFLGHSGAGKSTISDLAGDRIVLGDDMNLLSFEGGEIYAQAGAIGGKFYPDVDYSKKYKIDNFYCLNQGDENIVVSMGKSKALLKIISSFANLFWEEITKEEKDHCLDLAKEIVTKFNFYKLTFVKDKSVYEVIDG